MKIGALVLLMFLAAILLVFSVVALVGKAAHEVTESGGLKPIIAEIWCGNKECMDK